MKLVYIAHPVSGDIEGNLKEASEFYRWAVNQPNIVPIAPYFATLAAFSDIDPEEREIGFQHGLKVLQYCQELWVCGEVISRGMQREIDAAARWFIPIIYHEEVP